MLSALIGLVGCAGTQAQPSPSEPSAPSCATETLSNPPEESSIGDNLGSEASIGSPWPDADLAFAASLATGDIDGDGIEEVLVGSWDGDVTPFEAQSCSWDPDRGAAFLLAGPELVEVGRWLGNDRPYPEQLGQNVAIGHLLDGPAILLFANHELYVLPTDPLPSSVRDLSVVTVADAEDATITGRLAIGDLVGGEGDDLVLSVTDYSGSDDIPAVRILAGPVLAGGSVEDAAVVLDGAPGIGLSLAAADVDGDGAADLAAGATGQAMVFHGPLASGSLSTDAADVVWVAAAADDPIEPLVPTGDLDGDGRPELAVTEPTWRREGPARVFVVDPAIGGALESAPSVVEGAVDGDLDLGKALVTGDLDGDGQDDLAVGAPYGNTVPEPLAYIQARVYLFRGPLSGRLASLDADRILIGEDPGDQAGGALAITDLDGNGLHELLIGAAHDDDQEPDGGKLYWIESPL